MIKSKVDLLIKLVVKKVKDFPTFDLDESISDQRGRFFKEDRILVHEELYADLVEMLVSDLVNPFRREYVINLQLAETTINHINNKH